MRKFNIVWKGIMSTIYISLFLFFGQVNSQTNFYTVKHKIGVFYKDCNDKEII